MQRLRLFVFTVSHFCVDSYASMLTPALPFVRDRLGLTFAQIGLLGLFVQLSNLGQPLLGILGDYLRGRWLIIVGIAVAAVFAPLIGVVPSYAWLVPCVMLAGLGVSAFHPSGFALAGDLSGDRRAFGLALFIFGGTAALGFTPLWVPALVTTLGMGWLPLATIPGLLMLPFVIAMVPAPSTPRSALPERVAEFRSALAPVGVIVATVIVRSIGGFGFAFFLPLLGQERELSPLVWGLQLAVYNLSGVVGSLILGYLADRRDPKPLVLASLVLATPFMLLALYAEGLMALAMLALGGTMAFASNSIMVAMAQQHAPANAGFVSSLPGGFSWGVAGLTMPLFGLIADASGVLQAMRILAVLPLAAAVVGLLLPRQGTGRPELQPAGAGAARG